MIVEQDKVAQQREEYRRKREFLKSIIAKGEVYERLKSNKDFIEHIDDVRTRMKAHQDNTESYSKMLGYPNSEKENSEHPFMMKLRLMELITFHQTQRNLCEEIVGLADRVLNAKTEALEQLNELDNLEKEITHAD